MTQRKKTKAVSSAPSRPKRKGLRGHPAKVAALYAPDAYAKVFCRALRSGHFTLNFTAPYKLGAGKDGWCYVKRAGKTVWDCNPFFARRHFLEVSHA